MLMASMGFSQQRRLPVGCTSIKYHLWKAGLLPALSCPEREREVERERYISMDTLLAEQASIQQGLFEECLC